MEDSPTASVTFLFADPGDSLSLWEQHPVAMQAAVPRFRAALQEAVATHGGEVFNFSNDTLQAAFHSAPEAVGAALQAQRGLLATAWDLSLSPRLALLTGSAQRQGIELLGPAPHRAARLLSVANGWQILLCHITADLSRDNLPEGSSLLDLGEHRLPDLTHPERLFQLVAPGLPEDFPPLKSLDSQPTNLPIQPNALVGRQAELQAITKMLRSGEVRLLTLTGIGGTGKTRLALQAAADLLAAFPDGVFLAPLDQVADPNLAASAVAQALSIELAGNQTVEDELKAYLRSRRTLLVLDNFEHLLPAAFLVSELLAACPQLKILVTSREALHLRSEQEFPVNPLPLPDPLHLPPHDQLAQFASVALFIQRAQAVRPDFTVDSATAPAVAEICAFLDGLPLAIELAAARVRLFSPQVLLSRLKAQPAVQVLATGPRDLPTRQQTLHKAMEWSYNLLNPAEQALFRRLGVFAGGFTLDAVGMVCFQPGEAPGDALELLASLVEKNLVRRSEEDTDRPHFSLLFMLRQFALAVLDQAGELPASLAAHATHYVALAERAAPELSVGNPAEWVTILEQEHDNLRAALTWAISNRKVENGLRLAGSLWRFWEFQGYLSEGKVWLEKALSLPEQHIYANLRATALLGAARLADALGDSITARAYFEQSLQIRRESGDRQAIARSMQQLGYFLIGQGEIQPGNQLLEESIFLSREIGDKAGLIYSLNQRAILAMDQDDYQLASRLLEESLAYGRELGNLDGIAYALNSLGMVELYQKNYNRARHYFEESFKINRDLGVIAYSSETLNLIGTVLFLQGDLGAARVNVEQALEYFQEISLKQGAAESLEVMAGIAGASGNSERAIKIFSAAEALREVIAEPLPPADSTIYLPIISEARSRMKKDDFEKAWSAGRKLLEGGLDQVIAFALEPDEAPGQPSRQENPAGLTNRESEILRLLAQGLADAQIAESLFISPRTVNAHLTSIYSKLGVNSRAAATRFAVDNGLA